MKCGQAGKGHMFVKATDQDGQEIITAAAWSEMSVAASYAIANAILKHRPTGLLCSSCLGVTVPRSEASKQWKSISRQTCDAPRLRFGCVRPCAVLSRSNKGILGIVHSVMSEHALE